MMNNETCYNNYANNAKALSRPLKARDVKSEQASADKHMVKSMRPLESS
jgi:hypothetical protein